MPALVNLVLPTVGTSITAEDYRLALANRGCNWYRQIGSIGGAVAAKTLVCYRSVLTRQK